MKNKVYLIVLILLLILVVGVTVALAVFRGEGTNVNIVSSPIGEYINYSVSSATIGGNNTLNPGSDYTSGLSTEIEFWKDYEAHNFEIFGHIYLDINSGSDELLSSPALKWAVVSNNILISEGDFKGYVSGDSMPVLVNHKLLNTFTNFIVYVWLDENESMNTLTEGDVFSVSARSEVTLEEYLRFGVNEFDYTGDIQTINLNKGTYKLEVWGAQGGNSTSYAEARGGYGGYSSGIITLDNSKDLYVVVGGKGTDGANNTTTKEGGFNGGGDKITPATAFYSSAGGGATHIALVSGELSSFADTLEENLDNILLVAGGGGGGAGISTSYGYGGSGGGATGGSGYNKNNNKGWGAGGTQIAGGCKTNLEANGFCGTFGLGDSTSSGQGGAGGGGFYGGGSSNADNVGGGGGGSGYIGNPLLTNKVMYCYECLEDSNESTYTISTLEVNDSPISNNAKIGNGYARITSLTNYIGLLDRKTIIHSTDYDFKVNVLNDLPDGYIITYSTYDNANTLSTGEYQIRYLVEDLNGNTYRYYQKIEIIGG